MNSGQERVWERERESAQVDGDLSRTLEIPRHHRLDTLEDNEAQSALVLLPSLHFVNSPRLLAYICTLSSNQFRLSVAFVAKANLINILSLRRLFCMERRA